MTFAETIFRISKFLLFDLPPKRKIGPFNIIVLTHKGLLIPYLALLFLIYQNYSPGMIIYSAFHGTYALIWLFKDAVALGGTSFQTPTSLGSVVTLIPLSFCFYYWLPWLMASEYANQNPKPTSIGLALLLFVFGIVLVVGSETEKLNILRLKGGLVSTGFHSASRNPNYLGEMMVYMSFAIILRIWLVFFYLLGAWVVSLGPFIWMKEVSLAKKEGYQKYVNHSYLILPKIFKKDLANLGFYFLLFGSVVLLLVNDQN